jgi:hypothetical protein
MMMMDYFLFYEFMRQNSFSFMNLELLRIEKEKKIQGGYPKKLRKKLRGSCEYSHACRQ